MGIKQNIFQRAEKIVNVDRQKEYGDPYALHARVADMWNAYLGISMIKPDMVAYMMVMMKMSREYYKHSDDNLVDMMGYIGVADRMKEWK